MRKNKNSFQARLKFEPVYEVIFYSIIIFNLSLIFVFTMDSQAVTSTAVLLAVITVFLFYFKINRYLYIDQNRIHWKHIRAGNNNYIEINRLKNISFYNRKVEITTINNFTKEFYLSHKNMQKMYIYVNENYPDFNIETY